MIEEIAPGAYRITLSRFDALNVYLLGDVLVDSGTRFSERRLLRSLVGRPLAAHALSHAHPDHLGSSRALCEHFKIPLWCGEGDRIAVESGDLTQILPSPEGWIARVARAFARPGQTVSRALREGDEIGGFTVIEAPGHTPGHLAFWRARDRLLVLGDVLFNRNPVTLRGGLAEPFRWATVDPRLNRASARKLAALEPAVVCFGHGPPLRDSEALASFVAGLPD